MPQVWLTYDEIGEFLGKDASSCRSFVSDQDLSRRVSRDGQTRIKLPGDLAEAYMIKFARLTGIALPPVSAPAETAELTDLQSVSDLLDATRAAGIDLADVLTRLLRDVRAKADLPATVDKTGDLSTPARLIG